VSSVLSASLKRFKEKVPTPPPPSLSLSAYLSPLSLVRSFAFSFMSVCVGARTGHCEFCEAGRVAPSIGAKVCSDCDRGKYADKEGSWVCQVSTLRISSMSPGTPCPTSFPTASTFNLNPRFLPVCLEKYVHTGLCRWHFPERQWGHDVHTLSIRHLFCYPGPGRW
jgi:hypothetical protein